MKRIAVGLVAGVLGITLVASAAEVDRREQRQQERIADGVQSGQLTPRETVRLERKEARIDREIKRDRAANGGTLTPAERRKINREQNRVSRQIYREKHDAQHQ
jgi:signal transduction protein with GAF and PtsI domain